MGRRPILVVVAAVDEDEDERLVLPPTVDGEIAVDTVGRASRCR